MSETDRNPAAAIRVGDAERNAAVAALGEHMTTGRLDLDEYGNRSAKASTARTEADLQALFVDLPAPHPPAAGSLSVAAPLATTGHHPSSAYAPAPAATGPDPRAITPNGNTRAQRIYAGLMGVIGILAVIAFFTIDHFWPDSDSWLVFLLIPLVGAVGAAIWGKDWRRRL